MKTNISKAALVIFVIAGVGFSIFIAASAIVRGATLTALKRSPHAPLLTPRSYPDYHLERTRMLMNKIERYKKRLDSLSLYDSTKYKELLKLNPNLMENIQSIESLFNQLIKK